MSTVSVVIPTYNYARYLPDSVGSVLSQEGVDVRVLVIDDCSSDDTPEVAARLAEDPRVEYRRHAENKGHIATYNEGLLDWADGDYCALLSADDLLTPGALGRAARLLDADASVTFAYGGAARFTSGKPLPNPRTAGGRSRVWEGSRWIRGVCRAGRNLILAPEVVARTSAQHDAGGYDPGLPHSGDLEMWLRLAARGRVGWLPDADQAFYRVHDSNMHHSRFDARQRLDQLLGAYEGFFARDGALLDDPAAYRADAWRALARNLLRSVVRALDEGRDESNGMPVAQVVEMALELADVRRTPEYASARFRLRLGPTRARALHPLVSAATLQYPRTWLRWHYRTLRPV